MFRERVLEGVWSTCGLAQRIEHRALDSGCRFESCTFASPDTAARPCADGREGGFASFGEVNVTIRADWQTIRPLRPPPDPRVSLRRRPSFSSAGWSYFPSAGGREGRVTETLAADQTLSPPRSQVSESFISPNWNGPT